MTDSRTGLAATNLLFDPSGVVFKRVSPRLVTSRIITMVAWSGVFLIAGVVLALVVSPWYWLGAAAAVVAIAWEMWLAPRQVHALGYAERDDDLLVRRGLLFKSMVAVPYGRMQFVDVRANPLERALGIATVQLHTAAASTDATIPGLTPAEAEVLRDRLSARGEARLAGL